MPTETEKPNLVAVEKWRQRALKWRKQREKEKQEAITLLGP